MKSPKPSSILVAYMGVQWGFEIESGVFEVDEDLDRKERTLFKSKFLQHQARQILAPGPDHVLSQPYRETLFLKHFDAHKYWFSVWVIVLIVSF